MDNFRHKHSLGQNFLKDKKVLINIIDSVLVNPEDLVIEIGPGQGALTKYLKLYECELRCFEIDKRTKSYLDKYEDDKTVIEYKDIMDVDLSTYVSNIKYDKLYIISNLPYYITTPIVTKMINSNLDIEAMVFMVQNEVADRLSAKTGSKDYGAITVYLNYFYEVTKLFFVSRKSFDPVPNVDSAVIKLTKRENLLPLKDLDFFTKLVKEAFLMKRKNIRNNLKKYNLDIIENVLSKYNLDLTCRAENIPVDAFVELANELSENK